MYGYVCMYGYACLAYNVVCGVCVCVFVYVFVA